MDEIDLSIVLDGAQVKSHANWWLNMIIYQTREPFSLMLGLVVSLQVLPADGSRSLIQATTDWAEEELLKEGPS